MELIAIPTGIIAPGQDIASILMERAELQSGDVMAISSKAICTAEGGRIDLSTLPLSKETEDYALQTKRSAAFMQAVLQEVARMNGTIRGTCPGALLSELQPEGLEEGFLLAANAGLDESNAEPGFAIGWPVDPIASARTLSNTLGCPVVITDSVCTFRRWGVTAHALTVCGIDPLKNEQGSHDLFGRELRVTQEAVADQIATAANMLMGNADQCIPAVIIRSSGIPRTDFCGFVPGMKPEEDLFADLMMRGGEEVRK